MVFRRSSVPTLLLLVVVVVLLSFGGSTNGSGRIASTFSHGLPSPHLELSVIDPHTGNPQNQLFSTNNFTQPVVTSAAVDTEARTAYIPVRRVEKSGDASKPISVLGLAIDDQFKKAGVIAEIETPLVNINALAWDNGLRQLLAIGQEAVSKPQLTFWVQKNPLGSGDRSTLNLPLRPATNYTGGYAVPSVFYNATRSFIFPSFDPATNALGLVFLNIDTFKYTVAAPPEYIPIAMAHDQSSDTIYAILHPISTKVGTSLAYGTIDPRSFNVNVVSVWAKDNQITRVLGGVSTIGEDSCYALMADTNMFPPYLVTVRLPDGHPSEVTRLPAGVDPASLIFLP